MEHKTAQVFLKVAFISCLVMSMSWLLSGNEAHAENETSVIIQIVAGEDASIIASEHDAVVHKAIPTLGLFFVTSNHDDIQSLMANDSRVTAVYDDTIIVGQPRFSGAVGQTLEAQPWEPGTSPSTAYSEQWATSNIRLAKAHDISQGEGTTVAILDTGIDFDHELFQGKLVSGYDFVDNDDDPTETRDGLDQDGDLSIDEGAGHGTHVAGIIALTAPQANIMPIRIFDDEGRGLYFDLVAGIMYAVDHGADVINLSGSGPEDAPFLAEAVTYAEAHGVVIVAAGAVNIYGYPASYPSVISVGASNELDYPTDFSDFPEVLNNTVYAPGFSIISSYDDGSYAIWTGNSMATPFVAGTAALLLATDSCDDVCAKSSLLETAHPVVDDPDTSDYYGRIDAFDAVSLATGQFHTDLNVMFMDGDSESIDDLQLKPYFNIINNGNSLPIDELTLRYWFTKDSESEQLVECDFANVACDMIFSELGDVSETAVSDTYLELDFAPDALMLLGNHDTGNIQMRVHKSDWTLYDKLNDYSYNNAATFIENPKITLYHNGALVWGEEPIEALPPTPEPTVVPTIQPTSTMQPTTTPDPTAVPTSTAVPTTVPTATPQPTQVPQPTQEPQPTQAAPPNVTPAAGDIRVQYQVVIVDPYDRSIVPNLQLVNNSGSAIQLSDLRIRYWYTDAETAVIQAHCDYAALQCGNITAVTGKSATQHYLDITFAAAAGELAFAANSGQIHLRLHHTDWSPFDESDDYSFSSTATGFADSQNITLYQNDILIWGIEP